MNRWLLTSAFLVLVALLGAILAIVVSLATRGVSVHLAQPITLSGPLTVGGTIAVEAPVAVTMDVVEIRVPQPVTVDLPVSALDVRATLGGAPCPHCGEGTLLPVRWNLLTGEITWRCPVCGRP
ncbi:MAG: hypothetical protein BIP78_1353 [Candidatus Bipolaricaulis sibiricus]|uniref:Uncharacterized protein n=1 Tax=Bipolaricaulis sibiricus TaxID=2501609 RepID=A0A410FVK5_BIPS1|nr:MAG: hypothetical protein BIP78_1353 [Candidatus Bipolaricaulis sibiricus]